MSQPHAVLSPIFPPEKDIDVPSDSTPLAHSSTIQVFIKLVEPVVFLQGFEQNNSDKTKRQANDCLPPSILRGSLIVRILKPTKLKSISLSFKGYSRTEWPEGIPPKKQEFMEINDIINHTWPFYKHEHHKYVPANNNTKYDNEDKIHNEYLLKNSGASMFRSLSNNNTANRNSTLLNGFTLSPMSSTLNIPIPVIANSTNTSNNTSNTDTNNNTPNISKLRRDSVTSLGSASKNTPTKTLSPFHFFRRGSAHIESTVSSSSATPNHGHMHNIKNNKATTSPNSPIREPNRHPSSNTIFSDLFGFSQTSTTSNNNYSNNDANTPMSPHQSVNHNNNTPSNTNNDDVSVLGSMASSNINSEYENNGSLLPSDGSVKTSMTNNATANSQSSTIFTLATDVHESFTFEPGDYIYTFEQVISQYYPETIKADFGFVEYSLLATIERPGAFKADLNARTPVTIIRTPSDNSVEESEPIVISRDWEKQLYYDILIASKDIILDAFLPIHFTFSPLDKVTLHRIRIYITETMEYYCKNKKIHRMEPTKKFLLAEHTGPKLDSAPNDKKPLKAKYMGNLLEEDGFLVNKDFEYQVFIPSRFRNHQSLHPDTGFDNIRSNHWIKICLRLSRMIDNKRKHYEISIDSPMHVLNKLCSHANILLPNYESHLLVNNEYQQASLSETEHHSENVPKMYHDSNIFFPKEVIMSPLVSPEVQPLDINLNAPVSSPLPISMKFLASQNEHAFPGSIMSSKLGQHHSNTKHVPTETKLFKSPKLKSNLYQPESLQRELSLPQAIPLSPISSPQMRPRNGMPSVSDNLSINSIKGVLSSDPPDFESATKMRNESEAPKSPPSYSDVLRSDGIDSRTSDMRSNTSFTRIPKITLNKSQESLIHNRQNDVGIDGELDGDDNDIASGFSFQGSMSQNLPSGILRSHYARERNGSIPESPIYSRRSSIQENLPSTVRNNNVFFNDLSKVLSSTSEDDGQRSPPWCSINGASNRDTSPSINLNVSNPTSQGGSMSARSSMDAGPVSINTSSSNAEPLLHSMKAASMNNPSMEDSIFQSKDSINEFTSQPAVNTSVDITALYDRNSAAFHPLQLNEQLSSFVMNSHKKINSNTSKDSDSSGESIPLTDDVSSTRVSQLDHHDVPKHAANDMRNSGSENTRTIDQTLG